MKRIIYLLLCLIAANCFTNIKAQSGEAALSFTIKGEIQGLLPGDTLLFEKVNPMSGQREPGFNVIVNEADRFTYSSSHPHVQYYSMTYKPLVGEAKIGIRAAMTFLIREGVIEVNGTTDHIYFLTVKGGTYDDPLLQRFLQLRESLDSRRSDYIILNEEAREAGDNSKAQEYIGKYSSFRNDHQSEFEELARIKKELVEQSGATSEWLLLETLQQSSYMPIEELIASYERLTPELKASHYGRILQWQMENMIALAPGKDAPAFKLTTIDDKELSLTDFAGSYLLIYHWGLCPASVRIDPEVVNLHERYKDNLQVIGITPGRERIQAAYDHSSDEVYKNMLAHPWYEAESTGSNQQIAEDYAFAGFPYFIFISPDGKIIARDFFNAFYTAKETLEAEYGK